MADLQSLESLLKQGADLSRAKRFREAEPIFRQVLELEPRHTGAAYLLAMSLYFCGQFHQALGLFNQLTNPNSPLDKSQVDKLLELSRYSQYELWRLEQWDKGMIPDWNQSKKVDLRILDRSGRVVLMQEFRDVDPSLGSRLEAVRQGDFSLIPFVELAVVEFGPIKRWINAQVVFRSGRRETIQTPLTYRDSMSQAAFGVQEGVETILISTASDPGRNRAYGQKQFQSVSSKIPISEILRMEISSSEA